MVFPTKMYMIQLPLSLEFKKKMFGIFYEENLRFSSHICFNNWITKKKITTLISYKQVMKNS